MRSYLKTSHSKAGFRLHNIFFCLDDGYYVRLNDHSGIHSCHVFVRRVATLQSLHNQSLSMTDHGLREFIGHWGAVTKNYQSRLPQHCV